MNTTATGAIEGGTPRRSFLRTGILTASVAVMSSFGVKTARARRQSTTGATIRVPGDCSTLQAAVDAAGSGAGPVSIRIESGHRPDGGILVEGGDYSRVRVESEDAVVKVSASFEGPFIRGVYSRMPVLSCLVDLDDRGRDGYAAVRASSGLVSPGAGIRNAGERGLKIEDGSRVSADRSEFTGCNNINVRVRSSMLQAEAANFSRSKGGTRNVYVNRAASAFLAHTDMTGSSAQALVVVGATVDAEQADLSGAAGHGAEVRHASNVNLAQAKANNCGGRGIAAVRGAVVNFANGEARNNSLEGGSSDLFVLEGATIVASACQTTDGSPGVGDTNLSSFNSMDAGRGVIWA